MMYFSFFLLVPIFVGIYDTFYFVFYLISRFLGNDFSDEDLPSLSILIPAKNEADNIRGCLESVLSQDYPDFEVVLIDDGSSDGTDEIIDDFVGEFDKVSKIVTSGVGKWKCLNLGIQGTDGDVLVVDADTFLREDALRYMGRKLLVDDLVGGNLRVKRDGFLPRVQALEHLRISMFREVESFFGRVNMVPGAFSGYRREIFSEISFKESLTEDFNFFRRAKDLGFSVGYVSESRALTEMHEDLSDLIDQRTRWVLGNLEVTSFFSKDFGSMLFGDLVAFFDLFCFFLVFFYPVVIWFFVYETILALVMNWLEENHLWWETFFYPFPWMFLAALYLFIDFRGYWKNILGNNTDHSW